MDRPSIKLSQEDLPKLTIERDFSQYRAMTFYWTVETRPKGVVQWLRFLWGWDVWYEIIPDRFDLPLFKTLTLANVVVWLILFLR